MAPPIFKRRTSAVDRAVAGARCRELPVPLAAAIIFAPDFPAELVIVKEILADKIGRVGDLLHAGVRRGGEDLTPLRPEDN